LKRGALLLVLAALLGGCSRSAAAPRNLRAGETIRKAWVYLISIAGDQKAAGGCDAPAAPVEVELPFPSPALNGSIAALLDAGSRYENAGFYNALAHSPLQVDRIERAGDEARVYLTGYMEVDGECDRPRLLTQLTRTATQFSDVKRAEFFLDGKPLRDLLSETGEAEKKTAGRAGG
jgi:hypothetical protein